MPHYTPSKEQLSDPRTIQKLTETLRATYIYRNAQEFCQVRLQFPYTGHRIMMYTHVCTCISYIYNTRTLFTQCRDTFSVESFNHMLLTYASKRIHFSTCTFNMRMHLAVLDWNENVNRAYTSTHRVADLRRPDRPTPMKVLVDKTYNFVDVFWEAYMEHNKTDLRPLPDEDDINTDNQDELFEEGALVMDIEEEMEDENDSWVQ